MQTRVVELDDDLGPVRRRNPEAEQREGNRRYDERSPLDLIEEDKRPFARRKLLATCCGGCRTVYDEVTAKPIHPGLYALQILIYLFYPVMILVIGIIAMPEKKMRMEACTIVAGIGLVVGGVLHYISYYYKKQEMDRIAQEEARREGQNSARTRPRGNLA